MGMTINAAHTAVSIKVLLVEDTASERFYIAELLHQQGFEVIESASAEEALERLNEHHIDLVVSDWRMPGMSGPELCHIIKSRPQPPYVLMLTANADTGFLIQGIESGADDYLPKPFAPAVLRVRLLAAVRLIELNQALARQNAALERAITEVSAANQQLQADLHQAALLQQSLLPAPMEDINGWHCLSRFASASMLAGDLFNIIRLDEQNLGFYLIDVAGHGSAAAMQAFSLAMMLSPCRCDWHGQTPAGLMSMLNQGFVDPGEQGQYATALIGKLNTQNGQLSLASAGHPAPILLRRNSQGEDGDQVVDTALAAAGFPLGIMDASQYPNIELQLNGGDRLLLFSDGAYESLHANHGRFGHGRLVRLAHSGAQLSHSALISHLYHAIHLWQGGVFQDDVSLMLLCAPAQSNPDGRSHEQSAA